VRAVERHTLLHSTFRIFPNRYIKIVALGIYQNRKKNSFAKILREYNLSKFRMTTIEQSESIALIMSKYEAQTRIVIVDERLFDAVTFKIIRVTSKTVPLTQIITLNKLLHWIVHYIK